MIHSKVQLSGSLKPDLSAFDAFVASGKIVQLNWNEVAEAVGMYKHKLGLKSDKCIGFVVSNEAVTLLFER